LSALHQAVYHAILGVELGNDLVQQPRIAAFIPPENSVGDQIGQLQEARGL
jgi:hypothetical protein